MSSTLSQGAFNYNRFDERGLEEDSIMSAYRSIYEKCDDKKKEEEEDEDDEKDEEKDENDEKDEDEDNDEDDEDDKKKIKKLIFGKKIVKESVINYLINEGYANNLVSADIIATHMSDKWLNSIQENAANAAAVSMVMNKIPKNQRIGTPEHAQSAASAQKNIPPTVPAKRKAWQNEVGSRFD